MGKKKKEHRKKVAKRNDRIASQRKQLQKMYMEELLKQMNAKPDNFIPSTGEAENDNNDEG